MGNMSTVPRPPSRGEPFWVSRLSKEGIGLSNTFKLRGKYLVFYWLHGGIGTFLKQKGRTKKYSNNQNIRVVLLLGTWTMIQLKKGAGRLGCWHTNINSEPVIFIRKEQYDTTG